MDVGELALRAVYEKIGRALDYLAESDQKRAAVELRQCLPRGHKWSFEKERAPQDKPA